MSVFRFKQFSVRQTNAAMKVGTDAMLLGSLCRFEHLTHLLDIGTGTGVLSLMLAQRFGPETVTAVEIEPSAAEDARYNFAQCDFPAKFELVQTDIRELNTERLFDGIIANPPYFEQSSKSASDSRNLARHTDDLPFPDLMRTAARLLAPEGSFWLIAPTAALSALTDWGRQNTLFPNELIHLNGKPGTPVRVIICFEKAARKTKTADFTIRNADGSYSEAYIALTKAFHAVDLSADRVQ